MLASGWESASVWSNQLTTNRPLLTFPRQLCSSSGQQNRTIDELPQPPSLQPSVHPPTLNLDPIMPCLSILQLPLQLPLLQPPTAMYANSNNSSTSTSTNSFPSIINNLYRLWPPAEEDDCRSTIKGGTPLPAIRIQLPIRTIRVLINCKAIRSLSTIVSSIIITITTTISSSNSNNNVYEGVAKTTTTTITIIITME